MADRSPDSPTATFSSARRAWPTSTVTRSPRWPFARRTVCREIASLQPAARRAVEFICNSQDPVGGGWRYSPGQPGDTSVFGWNIFALRSAHLAGIKVPQKILKACSALSRPGSHRQIARDVSLSAGAAARRQLSRPGDDDRSPLEPPAPGMAARFPAPDQGSGHDLGPPSRIGRSGTSTTGTTQPSSCTT